MSKSIIAYAQPNGVIQLIHRHSSFLKVRYFDIWLLLCLYWDCADSQSKYDVAIVFLTSLRFFAWGFPISDGSLSIVSLPHMPQHDYQK